MLTGVWVVDQVEAMLYLIAEDQITSHRCRLSTPISCDVDGYC